MPNHVHLIVVPQSEDGLRRGLGEAHRRYTRRINYREGWRGHLGQGRFASFALDERYLRRAARYVALNPVRAKLCRMPWRWRWFSATAHVAVQDDGVVRVAPLLERVKDWREYLLEPLNMAEIELGIPGRQCLSQRIDNLEDLRRQAQAWEKNRDEAKIKVNWQFTTADARIKLKKLHPSLEE